jgi:hypothetical protein
LKTLSKEEFETLKEVAVESEVSRCLSDREYLESIIKKDIYWLWPHHLLERLLATMDKKEVVSKLGFDPDEQEISA